MKITGLDAAQLREAATDTGVRLNNFRAQGRGFAFTLRLEGELWRRYSHEGRKVAAVCYHGHAAFYQRVFDTNADAKVRSAMANFDGVADFKAKACDVGQQNAGSMIAPVTYGELCHCEGELALATV